MRGAAVVALVAACAAPRKVRSNAEALSSAGTFLPIGVVLLGAPLASASHHSTLSGVLAVGGIAGLAVGPSLGHWYAEDWFTVPLGVRIATAGIAGYSIYRIAYTFDDDGHPVEVAALLGAIAVEGVAAFWDLATAGRAADDYNREHVTVVKVGSGWGLGLAGRF